MNFHGGIEIDGDLVRATVLEGSPKKYRVVDFVEGRITGESEEDRRESLRSLLGPVFFGKERVGLDVAASIGADRAILREISVPYTRDEMISKTIRYESESYIFSHSVDDLIIEYLKCAETESGSRLILCGVEKHRLGEDLERLRSIEIDPVAVELNATALATAYVRSEPESAEGNTLLVQIERQHTTFVLLEEGRITKVRSVWNVIRPAAPTSPLLTTTHEASEADEPDVDREAESENAIEDRFAAIERSLSGLESDGPREEAPPTAGSDSGSPLLAVVSDDEYDQFVGSSSVTSEQTMTLAPVSDPFDRIILELERTFAGYLIGGSIDHLIVTGGEATEMDAVARLSSHFDVEARGMPLGGVELAIDGAMADAFHHGGAVSLGLAHRSLGLGITTFELRKEEFRFERRFERLMPALTLVSLLLCLLSLVWMVGEHRRALTVGQEIAVLRDRQADLFESFFGSPPREDVSNYHRSAEDRLKTISGQSANSGTRRATMKQYLGAMAAFLDFYQALERAEPKVYPTYDLFDFELEKDKGTKSTVKLHVPKAEDIQVITDALRAHSTYFTPLVKPMEEKAGGFELTIDLVYKHEKG